MKRFSLVVVMVMALVLSTVPAMAMDIILGQDTWVNNFFDKRAYDKSHPSSKIIDTVGGWNIGLAVFNDVKAAEIGKVEITGSDGSTFIQNVPWIYFWLDRNLYDYGVFFGHKQKNLIEIFEVKAFTITGDPINFIDWDGVTLLGTSLFITSSTTAPIPPICTINSMRIKNNGDIVVIFTAPYKNNPSRQIRIRVFFEDPEDGGEVQFSFNPPFEYQRADGSTKGDTIKAIIPAMYSGRTARIEYRLPEEGTGYMTRGIRNFQLP